MKALHFLPGLPPELVDVDLSDLRVVQGLIGGYFTICRLDRHVGLLCDDDGMAKDLEPNLMAVGPRYLPTVIIGPVLVVGLRMGEEGEDFCALSTEAIARYEGLPRLERE